MAEDECKEHFIELLETYKKNRCLWDSTHPLYSNKDHRNQAYNTLLNIYKKIKENATINDLKRKLDNMRTTYNRESKKVKDHLISGKKKWYVPKLWYYDYFAFLSKKEGSTQEGREVEDFYNKDKNYGVLFPQETQQEANSIDRISDVSFNTSVPSTSTSETITSTSTHPKRRKPRLDTFHEKEEQLLDMAANLLNSKQDQWELMGLSFGMQLRELDAEQQAIAQKLMSDVVYYGKMKKLTHFSTVQLSPSSQNSHFYSQPLSSHNHYSHIQPHIPPNTHPTTQNHDKFTT